LIIRIQEVFKLTVKSILLYLCMICNFMCILDVFWGYYKQYKCIWYSLRIFAVNYLCVNFLMYDCKKENGKEFFHSLNWALKIKFALNCNKIQKKAVKFLLCKSWMSDFETNWEETKISSKTECNTKKTKLKTRIKFVKFTNIKELQVFFQFYFSISIPYFLLHLSHCSLYDEKTSKTF